MAERRTLTIERKAMTPEEWEINKDCATKKRAHKWQWKLDIASGMPSMDHAICVHCGVEVNLTRGDMHHEPK
jgi:hypothetical protein